jgi:hypothetical protein
LAVVTWRNPPALELGLEERLFGSAYERLEKA